MVKSTDPCENFIIDMEKLYDRVSYYRVPFTNIINFLTIEDIDVMFTNLDNIDYDKFLKTCELLKNPDYLEYFINIFSRQVDCKKPMILQFVYLFHKYIDKIKKLTDMGIAMSINDSITDTCLRINGRGCQFITAYEDFEIEFNLIYDFFIKLYSVRQLKEGYYEY